MEQLGNQIKDAVDEFIEDYETRKAAGQNPKIIWMKMENNPNEDPHKKVIKQAETALRECSDLIAAFDHVDKDTFNVRIGPTSAEEAPRELERIKDLVHAAISSLELIS